MKFLAAGLTLTSDERTEFERKAADIAGVLDGSGQNKERLGLIAKLLLSYQVGGASAVSGEARAEAYLESLDDIPAWALAETIRMWHRGEVGSLDGQMPNYSFAPAPAILRQACQKYLARHTSDLKSLRMLLEAKPLRELL